MVSDPVLAEQRHYKRHMPSVATVVTYWRTHPQPWMKGVVIGWNIPFCFACGWIPPVKIHKGFKWKDTSRFLERAHARSLRTRERQTIEHRPSVPTMPQRDATVSITQRSAALGVRAVLSPYANFQHSAP